MRCHQRLQELTPALSLGRRGRQAKNRKTQIVAEAEFFRGNRLEPAAAALRTQWDERTVRGSGARFGDRERIRACRSHIPPFRHIQTSPSHVQGPVGRAGPWRRGFLLRGSRRIDRAATPQACELQDSPSLSGRGWGALRTGQRSKWKRSEAASDESARKTRVAAPVAFRALASRWSGRGETAGSAIRWRSTILV